MTEQMKAIAISSFGGPEVLELVERPLPEPGAGEVSIRVVAAGVSRPDALQRQGFYPPPPGASSLPGLEIAGVVAKGAGRFSEGDRVVALLAGGGYAEFAAVPVEQVLPLPRGLSMIEGAALPENFFTVWTNVFQRGRLASGETLLVHGGAGGIGATAVALGKAFGARVFATAGGPARCREVEAMGAERCFDHRSEDFAAELISSNGGRGADVILDIMAGESVSKNLEALAMEGRLVIIATMAGSSAEFNAFHLMQRRLTITGSTLRARAPDEKGRIARELEARVWPLLESRQILPRIDSTFELEDARLAHERLESRANIGKMVLRVADL
jgi:putative PIG3 family NAD(P)H quinone oxidoreductase